MGNFRKAVASLSLVAILSTMLVTATAFASYSDTENHPWAGPYANATEAAGITAPAEYFRPDDAIARDEVAKMIIAASGTELSTAECPFPDCITDDWSGPYLATAKEMGFILGDANGDARPKDSISRADTALMLYRVLNAGEPTVKGSELFSDVNEGDYFETAVAWTYENDIAKGYQDGSFGVANNITRAEFAKMIAVAYGLEIIMPEPPAETCEDGTEPPCEVVAAGGDLTVSLSVDSPDGDTIPSQASSVLVAAFDFEAGSEDAMIEELAVTQSGVGRTGDFEGLYLYNEEGERLTNRRSINSDTKAATFSNINVAVAAHDTVTLYVRADMADVADSSQSRFAIDSAADVVAGGDVSGSFPVQGALFGTSAIPAGTLIVTKSGTVSNPTIGQTGAKLAEFRLEADGEDAYVQELSLTVDGAIDGFNVKNLELRDQNEEVIATSDMVTSEDLAVFVLPDAFKIEDGSTRTFKVYGDVTGDAGDDIRVYFDVDADIYAEGGDYHFGMNVDRSAYDGQGAGDVGLCDSVAGQCSYSTLEGGDVTLTDNGPAAADVSLDGDDVTLLEFSITSASDAQLIEFDVNIYANDDASDAFDGVNDGAADNDGLIDAAGNANLNQIKIINVETGSTVMSSQELNPAGDDAVQTLTFDDEKSLKAGQTLQLAVVTDITKETTFVNNTIGAELVIASVNVEDQNGDRVAAGQIVPSTDITGNEMTVIDAELFVDLSGSPSSDTFVKGTTEVPMAGFNFRSGDSEDVTVTQITTTCAADTNGDGTYAESARDFISKLYLYSDGELLEGPESVNVDGTSLFENMNFLVPASASKKITIVADLAKPTVTNDMLVCGITADTDVVAQDETGDAVGNDIPALGLNVDGAVSVEIEVIDSGTLSFKEEDGEDTNAKLVIGGMDEVVVSQYKFSAVDESYTVNKLELWLAADGADVLDNTYVSAYRNIKLRYPDASGQEVVKSVSVNSSGEMKVSGMGMFVEEGEDAYLEILVDVAEVNHGANSGDQIRVLIDPTANNAVNTFEAVGMDTTTSVDVVMPTNNNKVETHIVRNTKPTVTKATSGISTSLISGSNNTIYGVTVSADANDSVSLRQLNFTVGNQTSNNVNGFTFFDGTKAITDEVTITSEDGTVNYEVGGGNIAAGATANVVVRFGVDGDSELNISAGQSKTFYLKANVTLGAPDSESVSVYIADDETNLDGFVAIHAGVDFDVTRVKYVAANAADGEAAAVSVIYDANNNTVANDGFVCANNADDILLGGPAVGDCGKVAVVTAANIDGDTDGANVVAVVYDRNGNNTQNDGDDIVLAGVHNAGGTANAISAGIYIATDNGASDNIFYDVTGDTTPADNAVCGLVVDDLELAGGAVADCEAINTTGDFNADVEATNFIWSDNSDDSHDMTTADWFNGFLVEDLVTETVTVSEPN